MKKKLLKILLSVILLFLILILPVNYWLQHHLINMQMLRSSETVFWQLEQLMESSNADIEAVKEDFSQECLTKARMAAYISQQVPSVVTNIDESIALSKKLNVDELHFFTADGTIFAGTHPEYYGYSFSSGEQMAFFKPMLTNLSLELCQDITPNTAEGKMMQYAAVWQEDGGRIVQIGMKPERVMAEVEKKALPNLLSMIPTTMRGNIHVADADTGIIIASTLEEIVGESLADKSGVSELKDSEIHLDEHWYEGLKYRVAMEKNNGYIFLNTYSASEISQDVLFSTFNVFICLFLLAVVTIIFIMWYMDSRLVRNLNDIVRELRRVETGNLDSISIDTDVPEFKTLLYYINKMLESVQSAIKNFLTVLRKSNAQLGIYETNSFYNLALASDNVFDILRIDKPQNPQSPEALELVRRRIREIQTSSLSDKDESIYRLEANGATYYIRLEEISDEQSKVVWMMDVTDWRNRMSTLQYQSGRDAMTNLYNRRGFAENMQKLFEHPEQLQHAAVVMIDADGLKQINDNYGHLIGDIYLNEISKILTDTGGKNSVCARLGGDEFILFLYGHKSSAELKAVLSAFETDGGQHILHTESGLEIPVRFSFGCSFYPEDELSYHELMRIADERMYQSKRSKKEADAKS
ncbi:MAG: GGDEF domain-containing protein [Candidatus Heteroscillospira sp.]|jgi:diguanylate cyclase (GGDEF)-like protein